MSKRAFSFATGTAEGSVRDAVLLGRKGALLHELAVSGVNVPAGATLTTKLCKVFFEAGNKLTKDIEAVLCEAVKSIEAKTGRTFGGANKPLFLSVRPSAVDPMPGALQTVLNVGLTDAAAAALAIEKGEVCALTSRLRFVRQYAENVLALELEAFDEVDEALRIEPSKVARERLQRNLAALLKEIESQVGKPFPEDAQVQLFGAVRAVLKSWNDPASVMFRHAHKIDDAPAIAITVQAMTFGNADGASATGIASTRDPATGEKRLSGIYLPSAQGSQIKGVGATGLPIGSDVMGKGAWQSMQASMPEVYNELLGASDILERHFKDAQEVEFTVENGVLNILKSQPSKRSARAGMTMAVDLANEGKITRQEAVALIDPAVLDQLLHPTIDPNAPRELIGTGMPASPGAATGEIVFSSEEAERRKAKGRKVILVRTETSPEDVHGMHAADGVLTTRGGMTSHAAVVARGLGKPCVTGANSIRVDYEKGLLTAQGAEFKRGDVITIDGGLGQILKGAAPMLQPGMTGDFGQLMEWADTTRRMKVRANADTPADARMARSFGAEGIGLCRTEHMFFGAERIAVMREMIVADSEKQRRAALDKLLPMQRADFVELFEIMAGLPVTIRLLDPPLHEFLPKEPSEFAEVAKSIGMTAEKMRERVNSLYEFNPMLGHRGCRLAVSYPEIPEMQARAIFEAAIEAGRKTGKLVEPEIMVPLVSLVKELDFIKARIDAVAEEVMRESGLRVKYIVGTMIELPRACIRAGVIAETSEFFSFGTNDLTQTTFGISRDDSSAFLLTYQQKSITDSDPFITLDQLGVGELIKMAVERGKAARPDIKLGICGEHGGEPRSIAFFENTGLDYVSCSPFRVPVARLSAAQALIRNRGASS
jgi:pyruvate, orthophosphate dikinase